VRYDRPVPKPLKFDPDWVVAPGETLREWRLDNGLPTSAAATACAQMPLELYAAVEAGDEPITENVALGLEHGTQIPAFLWLNLERAYRAGLAAGKTRV
jgi:plasmid maintenance system antidote protein VapI